MINYLKDLMEYFKIDEEEARKRVSESAQKIGDEWNIDPATFYQRSEQLIYRTARERGVARNFLKEIVSYSLCRGDEKILDYGCGSGNYLLPLSTLGFDVTGVEVKNSKILDWARWRANKHNLTCKVIDHEEPLPEIYDAIIFSDVLEHVPHPFQVVKKLHRALKTKGMLYITYSSHGDEVSNMKEINEKAIPFIEQYFWRIDGTKLIHKGVSWG